MCLPLKSEIKKLLADHRDLGVAGERILREALATKRNVVFFFFFFLHFPYGYHILCGK